MTNWLHKKRAIGIALFSLSMCLLVTAHLAVWFGWIFPEANQIVDAGSKVMQENKDQSLPTFYLWTFTKELGMSMGMAFMLSSAGLVLGMTLSVAGFFLGLSRPEPKRPIQPPQTTTGSSAPDRV